MLDPAVIGPFTGVVRPRALRGEAVAGAGVLRREAGPEPLFARRSGTVGPALRIDPPGRLLLDAVVTHRGRRPLRLGDLTVRHRDVSPTVREAAPGTGVAVGLEFESHRQGVRAAGVALLLGT